MPSRITLSLVSILVIASAAASAQDLTIDNFSTGAYASPQYRSGSHSSNQNGTMLGGNRSEGIYICAAPCGAVNPYNQVASYTIQPATRNVPSAFIHSAGFDVPPRVEVGYGFGAPMNVDLSSYDRIRLNFLGLTQPLNFNIQLFTGTAYAQGGCNIQAYGGNFSVELPLALFTTTTGFSQADVTLINLIFQSGSVLGSVSYGITSVEASSTAKPGAVSCHY